VKHEKGEVLVDRNTAISHLRKSYSEKAIFKYDENISNMGDCDSNLSFDNAEKMENQQ